VNCWCGHRSQTSAIASAAGHHGFGGGPINLVSPQVNIPTESSAFHPCSKVATLSFVHRQADTADGRCPRTCRNQSGSVPGLRGRSVSGGGPLETFRATTRHNPAPVPEGRLFRGDALPAEDMAPVWADAGSRIPDLLDAPGGMLSASDAVEIIPGRARIRPCAGTLASRLADSENPFAETHLREAAGIIGDSGAAGRWRQSGALWRGGSSRESRCGGSGGSRLARCAAGNGG